MYSYKRLNKARLEQICAERGIGIEECRTKRDLIARLDAFDLQSVAVADDDDNSGRDNDSATERHPVNSGDAIGQGPERYDEMEPDHSESVEALRLKLQIIQAQTELERERREAQSNRPNQNAVGFTGEMRDIKSLLPVMTNDSVLSFFITIERVLQLNDVPRHLWARYLPSQMTPKALQTFSRMTQEDSTDYDKIKEAILNAYNLNPKW